MAVVGAEVFLASLARAALAAADPGIDRDLGASSIETGALDHARDLMPQRERQRAAFAHIERFAFAEREIAVLHVQVGMADAAALDANEHLAALWLRAIDNGFAERGLVGGQREAAKFRHEGTLPRMILSENRVPLFGITRR